MKRKIGAFIVFGLFTAVLFAMSTQAGTKVADVVEMKNPIYKTHTQKLVLFSHQKHATTYKIDCATCHHDETGKPLTGLKPGDMVESCATCHPILGDPPKLATQNPRSNRLPKQLTKAEQLQYYTYTMHMACKDCHADYNAKNNVKTAPVTCAGCHTK